MSDNRVLDAVMGLCVGDALGVPVEFRTREDLLRKPVKGMLSGGVHGQPAGTWSDDSSLVFCLMDSLLTGYDIEDIGLKFQMWLFGNLWTPHGEVFDAGITTRRAIEKLKAGMSAMHSGPDDESNNGNGSLMRVLPLIFFLKKQTEEEKFRITEEVSGITHGHVRAKIACAFYVQSGINILAGMDLRTAFTEAGKLVDSFYENRGFRTEVKYFRNVLSSAAAGERINSLKSDGYVVHTLEAAVWCILNSSSYPETVLSAVNLGYDTDTTAAVAGGLAGLYYGIEDIPDEWIDAIARRGDVVDLCVRFNHLYGNPE